MNRSIWIYLLIMSLVSFIIRVLPVTLIRTQIKNRFIRSLLPGDPGDLRKSAVRRRCICCLAGRLLVHEEPLSLRHLRLRRRISDGNIAVNYELTNEERPV